MAGLASALAQNGCTVTYIAEKELTADRVQLGWSVPDMRDVRLRFVSDSAAVKRLVSEASGGATHLCQGIRANGMIGMGQRALARCGFRQWAVMETVDNAGALGMYKRLIYNQLFRNMHYALQGVLAIGHRTMDWVIARGMPAERVYPFAYFLPDVGFPTPAFERPPGPFRFLFVGQFIRRKRLDLLVSSLQGLLDREFELLIIGAGPHEHKLRELAERTLPGRIRWFGMRPQTEVLNFMARTDCLVLPSRHDGWGAVIAEALMAGTPVICSEACGAAEVVQASGVGGVFPRNSGDELRVNLRRAIEFGPLNMEGRLRLASWASALGAEAGARYLLNILDCAASGGSRPMPPWHTVGL